VIFFSRAEEYQEASDEELLALGEQLIEKNRVAYETLAK